MSATTSESFGDLLRRYRVAAGLTQEELAERAQVSPRAISDLERGQRTRPWRDTIQLLVDALHLESSERAQLEGAARRASRPAREAVGHGTQEDASPPRHNLPIQVTSFVGRERELTEIKERLATTRLLTLTGAGGCGKTRLALKLGETAVDDFADGVWLVELAPLADPSLIPQVVATAVGAREIAGHALTKVLIDTLRPRRLLLILDNCEHLIADCAQVAETLLRGCPHLRIVATSREILGAAGETVWRVPSLAAPDPRRLPNPPADRVEPVASSDAVRLFVERAHQVLSAFQVTSDNALALAEICFRLDGIPLALELAAARVRVLGVEQIASRLDDRFHLLTGGGRTVARRQQTLRASIDWSYDLLAKPEQAFFRKLSVFVGGWRLEAAESIGASPDAAVLDLLTALADKSLVAVEITSDPSPRYRLLETLRAYARERLVAGNEAEAAHAVHATYYLELAEHLTRHWQDVIGLVRTGFVDEVDNFRATLRWFAATQDWDGCVRMVGCLGQYWISAGYLDEGGQWLELALQHTTDVSVAKRGRVLERLGQLVFVRGDFTLAESLLRESIRLEEHHGDRLGRAMALGRLGYVLRDKQELPEALTVLQEALRLGRDLGEYWLVAEALFQLGLLARQQGDYRQAEELLAECLRVVPTVGSLTGFEGMVRYNLGLVAEDQGDLPRARSLYSESIPLARASGFRWLLPYILEGFVTLAARQGKAERAMVLAGAAATARQRVESPIPPAMKPRLDQAIVQACEGLGPAADGAWAEGQAMPLEQAIAYAMSDETHDS